MTENDPITVSARHFQEIDAVQAGKRLGVQWCPWMDDWFTSWSPRNSNSNAEGPWDQWVDLAVRILRDPMTEKVRPQAHIVAQQLEPRDFYDEANRYLSEQELRERFGSKEGE